MKLIVLYNFNVRKILIELLLRCLLIKFLNSNHNKKIKIVKFATNYITLQSTK